MSATEMVDQLQGLVHELLGYGARAPKDLMLFVKNLMFLNAATATLAPRPGPHRRDRPNIHQYFLTQHGERLARELGVDPGAAAVDVDAIKAGFLVPADVDRLTFADLQERRRTILRRMGDGRPAEADPGFRALHRRAKLDRCPNCPRCRPSPSASTRRWVASSSPAGSRWASPGSRRSSLLPTRSWGVASSG